MDELKSFDVYIEREVGYHFVVPGISPQQALQFVLDSFQDVEVSTPPVTHEKTVNVLIFPVKDTK